MAGLTQTPEINLEFRNKAKKSHNNFSRRDSAVYIRYKDHVLFKNIATPIQEAIERETIGWLIKQNKEIMLIEHDRTISNIQLSTNQESGLVILKSCIIEIHQLPLQKNSEWTLNSQESKAKAEYALQTKKRKTPKNNKKGAKK
jgi:hypothetical protein